MFLKLKTTTTKNFNPTKLHSQHKMINAISCISILLSRQLKCFIVEVQIIRNASYYCSAHEMTHAIEQQF